MLMTWNNFTHKRQKGFTIVELMVAIVIIAIGILGHAKLVTYSMKTTQTAKYMTQYDIVVTDLISRLNSLPDEVAALEFDSSNNTGSIVFSDNKTVNNNCGQPDIDDCDDMDKRVSFEVTDWYANAATLLPKDFKFSINTIEPAAGATLGEEALEAIRGDADITNSAKAMGLTSVMINIAWDESHSGKELKAPEESKVCDAPSALQILNNENFQCKTVTLWM